MRVGAGRFACCVSHNCRIDSQSRRRYDLRSPHLSRIDCLPLQRFSINNPPCNVLHTTNHHHHRFLQPFLYLEHQIVRSISFLGENQPARSSSVGTSSRNREARLTRNSVLGDLLPVNDERTTCTRTTRSQALSSWAWDLSYVICSG